MDFSVKQTQALDILEDDTTKELLFGGAAGGGKSILGCYWLMKSAMKYADTRWLMGRSVLKTLRETTLVSFFKVAKYQGLTRGTHFRYVSPSNILFPNGSEILLKDLAYQPSDPEFDELGSLELTGAFIDEANQVVSKAKQIVRSRIRHGLDENGLIPKSLYTCNPAKNWVKTEFYTPALKGTLPVQKKFIQSLVKDNPLISKHYIESLGDLDKASRARLRDGDWEYNNDPSMLMTNDSIANIFRNSGVRAEGDKYITVDPARMGKDSTTIYVWHGWRVIERIKLFKKKITESAEEVKRLMQKHSVPAFRVLADEDGVGGGLVDILQCKGFINNSKAISPGPNNFTGDNYVSLKAQCAFYTAHVVNNGKVYVLCSLDDEEIITQELEQIKRDKMDNDKRNSILPKDKVKAVIGRSPDDGDNFIMRGWFDVCNVSGFNVMNKTTNTNTTRRTI